MEKVYKLIAITISIIILGFSITFFFLPKKDFSENEFRYLTEFPKFSIDKLFKGTYIPSLENYTTDHFPLRDNFVSLKTKAYLLSGQEMISDVYIAKDHYLINRFKTNVNQDKIIKTLNKFQNNNPNINIEMLLSPTSTSINEDKLPKHNINESELDIINYYYNNLNFKTIDIYNILKEEKDNYQLFYKTDHHWTSYGAYFAYKQYCIDNNITYYNLDDLNITKVSDNFLGTLYSKVFTDKKYADDIYKINTLDYDVTIKYLNKITDDFYQEKYLKEKDKYSYFLGNNEPIIEITNNKIDNKEKLLIIKDSYANSFIPLIANHYQIIIVIDPRYYNLNISDYIKDNNIKNVLFLYNINNIDTDIGIIKIR